MMYGEFLGSMPQNDGEVPASSDFNNNCDICRGPEIYGGLPQIIDAEFWRVELNPNQQLLGRSFIGLKRHASTLAELTRSEILEHHDVANRLDRAARQAFGASMINLMLLMNDSVDKNQEPHIHSHLVPRYEHPYTLGNHTYADVNYGKHYNHDGKSVYKPSIKEIETITREMQRYIS